MKSERFIVMVLATLAVALGVAGCNRDTLVLTIRSPQDLNAGRPVRMLVRAVDQQEYVNESYVAVADKVVVKDDSVLYSAVVYPQLPLMVSVKKGEKSIGVYFFFTQPGSRWKTLLEMPLPHVTEIRLSTSNIDSVKQH
jgi:hypothetical protein